MVTGFLGSGKTTLIAAPLNHPAMTVTVAKIIAQRSAAGLAAVADARLLSVASVAAA